MSIVSESGSLTNDYSNFIAVSRYARWMDDEGRRETWTETVGRYVGYMSDRLGDKIDKETINELNYAIVNQHVMPSMRALMTSGPALERENVASFNCAFLAVDHLRAFDETLYILMNGTGVGFSVELEYVSKLPVIAEDFYDTDTTIVVHDSKLGWAKSYKELISLLVQGQVPRWDVSKVRPAGSRLKTFGGRASGPEPLVALFEFTVKSFKRAAGRKLRPIEAHDIMCKIAEVVVVGGVRRSALLSQSDLGDHDMATAKNGQWWESNPQRALSNNSAVYHKKPSVGQFFTEWSNLYESKSGERGIINMDGIKRHIDSFGRRDSSLIAGKNPCSEINLRSSQMCNLTEVVIYPDDSLEQIIEKVKVATILGTYQSTLTNFKYLRSIWKKNTEEERLLGVSLTGIYGHRFMNGTDDIAEYDGQDYTLPEFLEEMRGVAVETNREWAEEFGINPSAAVTTIKPSGTVSQLVGVSSGLHPWYAPYYIRTVRGDNKDPLTRLMKDEGIPNEPDVMKPNDTTVFSFPIKAPDAALVTKSLSAIEHLELYKVYREHWTDHDVSVTINVKEEEWPEVGAWVYNNFDSIGGVSFLPASDHTYQQAPYQPVSQEDYNIAVAKMPKSIDWVNLSLYELEDATTGAQELACVAGPSGDGCEVVDLTK